MGSQLACGVCNLIGRSQACFPNLFKKKGGGHGRRSHKFAPVRGLLISLASSPESVLRPRPPRLPGCWLHPENPRTTGVHAQIWVLSPEARGGKFPAPNQLQPRPATPPALGCCFAGERAGPRVTWGSFRPAHRFLNPRGLACLGLHVACPRPVRLLTPRPSAAAMAPGQLGEALAEHGRVPPAPSPATRPSSTPLAEPGKPRGRACRLCPGAGPGPAVGGPLPIPGRTPCQSPRIMRNAFCFSSVQCV